jgi:hypothetical protein
MVEGSVYAEPRAPCAVCHAPEPRAAAGGWSTPSRVCIAWHAPKAHAYSSYWGLCGDGT